MCESWPFPFVYPIGLINLYFKASIFRYLKHSTMERREKVVERGRGRHNHPLATGLFSEFLPVWGLDQTIARSQKSYRAHTCGYRFSVYLSYPLKPYQCISRKLDWKAGAGLDSSTLRWHADIPYGWLSHNAYHLLVGFLWWFDQKFLSISSCLCIVCLYHQEEEYGIYELWSLKSDLCSYCGFWLCVTFEKTVSFFSVSKIC